MNGAGPIVSVLRGAVADALAFVLPVDCAGCGLPDVALCAQCRAHLRPHVHRVRAGVWSGLAFDGVPARVIRALKADGRTGLARALAPALAAAVRSVPAPRAARAAEEPVIVPIPTSRAAYRRRGYRVVELVARRAGLRCARLLVPVRVTADQRGLDRSARRRNVAGSLRAHGAEGLRVVLIDDVVTTGATLEEAIRALHAGGAEVLGAATIAATVRRDAGR